VQPFTHADEFGRFYAAFVFLLCPLIGFAIFWLGSKHRIGGQLWKPLAIATIFATPLERLMRSGFSTIGLDMLWGEVIRTALVLLLMIWSVGAMRNHSAIHDPVRVSDNPPSQ
jgi:Na+-transporting methylmalonyl-CoA/oxaloacetate decarboxylase beta subunit